MTIAKDLGPFVAIFDSRGRNFTFEADLRLGEAIALEDLLKLSNRSNKSKTKEAHTSSIGTAMRRPEGIAIKGANLDDLTNTQTNASYRLTTLKVDNLDREGRKQSSYYLGVDSGRVSDQKKRNFTLNTFNAWLEDIKSAVLADTVSVSELLNSYAKPVRKRPDEQPQSVILDLTHAQSPLNVCINDENYTLDNNFLYFSYDSGINLFMGDETHVLTLEFCEEEKRLIFQGSEELCCASTLDGEEEVSLLEFINESSFKVLYPKGLTYSSGEFYQFELPTQRGFSLDQSRLGRAINPISELKKEGLTEKGDIGNITPDGFDSLSMFHLLDQLRHIADTGIHRSALGPFFNYLPDIELILCTDMGTEPADFIFSSPNKLVYVHVKCGGAAINPKSSAGAVAEVGSQAIKNLEMLISNNLNLKAANWNTLLNDWPSPNSANRLHERIRLFNGERFSAASEEERESKLEECWQVITERRSSSAVQKEIWVVVGNAFSRAHFATQLEKGNCAAGESLQAYQLIQSWIAAASNNDVELKLFVSE